MTDLFKINGENWSYGSANTKASKGKAIFKENWEIESLELITKANHSKIKGGSVTIARAKELIYQYNK